MGQKRLSGGQLKLNNVLSLDRVAVVAWKGGIDRRECEFCIDVFTDVLPFFRGSSLEEEESSRPR